MLDVSRRDMHDTGDRTAILLEFVAASAIFLIVAVVLYAVFSYRPV